MARILLCAPEISRWSPYGSGQGLGFTWNRNFDGDGIAFLARSSNTGGSDVLDFPIGPSADSGGTVFTYDSLYYFMRFRVGRLPSAQTELLTFRYRTTTLVEFHFMLNTDGTITAYNDAGTANLVATSGALTLGSWSTIYGRLVGSRTTNNVGGASFFLNGVSVYDNFTPGSLAGAGLGLNALAANPFYRVVPNLGLDSNVGCEADLDQLLCDDTDAITSASRFTWVPVTGNGTFTAWTSVAGTITNDWKYRNQRTSQMTDTLLPAPYCQAALLNDESSWTTQTLRQAGITTGVRTAIIVHNNMNVTNARHFYTRNGGAQQYEVSVTPAPPADDWTYSLHDATSWGLDDAIQIGVSATSGAGARCGHIGLWIEHTTPFVPSTDGNVIFQRINYTGTGSGAGGVGANEVTLPFAPTFLLICQRTGTGVPATWSKGHGWIHSFNDTPRRAAYVYSNKLILGDAALNATGIIYDVLCIKDNIQRMIGYNNNYQVNQTVPFDTDNEQQNTTLAAPTAIWSWNEDTGFSDIAGYLMGPGQASDASIQFNPAAALTANIILSLNATGFVYRRGRYVSASGGQYNAITFKPEAFSSIRLYDIFTYVGDGTANRVVPLVNFPNDTPVWVIVFPHNNSTRYMRNNQMANATPFDGGALNATAIANFAVGSFTVNGTTNTNAITFTAFVFIEGTDSEAANQYSGIYNLNPAARHDTLWDRSGAPTTVNVKIPNPLYRTHFVGDG